MVFKHDITFHSLIIDKCTTYRLEDNGLIEYLIEHIFLMNFKISFEILFIYLKLR